MVTTALDVLSTLRLTPSEWPEFAMRRMNCSFPSALSSSRVAMSKLLSVSAVFYGAVFGLFDGRDASFG